MKNTKIKRGTPFAWQDKRHLRAIKENFTGADRRNLLLLFVTITWMESDFANQDITYFRNGIKTYSGLSKKSISEGLKKLEKIGVLSIKQTRNKGVFSGIEIEILNKNTEAEKMPLDDTTVIPFSDVRKTDVRKMTTIEENTKKKKVLNRINNNTTNVVLEAELLSEGGKNKNTPLSESEIQKEKSSAKKEKAEYGNADINIMIEAIKSSLQLSGFKESQAQQRMAGKHLVNLAKNIGADEFKLRFVALYKDNFHRKNMGSLFYIYRQIKGFVPANNTLSSNVAKYD